MSYALVTKKRKFHRVLDSLSGANLQRSSNASSSTTTPHATQTDSNTPKQCPTIKRVRVASSGSVTNPDGMVARKSVSNTSLDSSQQPSPQPRPNFVPWDRERFLERLETFRRVDRWSPKPAPINEVQWAKRGWSCVDVMRVECVGGCGCAVVVKLPEDVDDVGEDEADKIIERREVEARLVEEYSKLISDGHAERCPWRKSGCDDTIQRLPLTNPETTVNSLHTRYLNLASLESKLPPIDNIQLPSELDLDETLRILPPTFLSDTLECVTGQHTDKLPEQPIDHDSSRTNISCQNGDGKVNKTAFALATFGWDATPDIGAGLATCGACFRRLGLWMYKPKEDGNISVYAKLDVVGEHLDYCPWVNPETQSGGRKPVLHGFDGKRQSGWEILAQAIKTVHRRRTRGDIPSTPAEAVEAANQESLANPAEDKLDDDEKRKLRDREWWIKLRRVRQSLQVKSPKKTKYVAGGR
ncbi:C3HC zinc finger domain-containing protein [Histoplasma ohiense]|nr:C3HC zinc finger domain-containing protein [Histoplasma ohiense (nom. inval.)]